MATYRCKRCNYLYIDEEQKVPFETVDEDYKCPRCRASKRFFLKKNT
ncbi:MAG: rubredoxin [Promethearchaeota archaeon]